MSSTNIVVDVMGGDFAPTVVSEGIALALAADSNVRVIAVGSKEGLAPLAGNSRVQCVETTEVIAMDEHPASAVRTKKDSSIVVGCKLVKEGVGEGFFSAGSTGACMAAATLGIGRIKGVKRPAIATILPGENKPFILTDVGANADCKVEYLTQFALMDQAYSKSLLGTANPAVRLLNIGSEDTKGSAFALECYEALSQSVPNFEGNIEGKELLEGVCDVVVTDGFTGNVTLKTIEGTSKMLMKQVKSALTATTFSKLCALPLAGNVKKMKAKLDPDQFGGAPLLGVKGVVLIGHGSSNAQAICSGILATAKAARAGLTEKISAALT